MSSASRILVLEDQRIDWEVLEPILKSKGYDPDWARTEQEARDLLDKHVQSPRYLGAIIDIIAPVDSVSPLDSRTVFENSLSSGVRVCKYIRDTLRLKPNEFRIVILSILGKSDLQMDLEKYSAVYFGKIELALNREGFNALLASVFGRGSQSVTPPGSTNG
jgi:CheY-like chemotaxis protein